MATNPAPVFPPSLDARLAHLLALCEPHASIIIQRHGDGTGYIVGTRTLGDHKTRAVYGQTIGEAVARAIESKEQPR